MTRRLSSTRSHTEDSIFLRPDEDPVWLDEPAKIEKLGDGVPKNDQFPKCKDGPAGGQSPQGEEVFMHKVYALVVQIHCWAAVFVISQVTGSSKHQTAQLDHPRNSGDGCGHLRCHGKTWNGSSGFQIFSYLFICYCEMEANLCPPQVVHMVYKWRHNSGLCSGMASQDMGDRRQSVSRQPSFTLSEWTDAQEDLLDTDAAPQTPVFEMGTDTKTEGDAATLTVTAVGLQERRGSNVSLTLDMCTPGCTEPYGYGAQLSPRDQSAQEYLRQGTHVLTPIMLHTRAMDDQSLQSEFYETPMNFVDPKEYNYPGLVRKNRYKTILPNTHSRVILKSHDEEDFLSTYINANYLKGYGDEDRAYIATQGPTVNTMGDFWRMVWQERSPIIVMITNLEEKNEKCAEYWPEDTVTHEGIEITVVTVTQEDDYSLRVFTLNCDGEERSLHHYWYTSWPDQKTPDKAPPLLELVQQVERARDEAPPLAGPTVVHCSAGIGRTGCFIATSILCKQLRTEGVADILRTMCQLRLDRGGMIQTCEQYQFVHHVLSLYEKQISHTAEE
uniref:protein-tyrosine-phosphatase n=1 Tax=Takifugu rubripes TaxID=31033 RepID=A0A674NKN5_TAKRU